eukprot:Sspe_Gene.46702::Locus_23413_Transcript_1_1_Confidence_1.000_Length_2314::g.46702::m.46702/K10746/EXO1; exonuclease 1
MGIAGLLPALRSIEERCHVSRFSGKRIGIDAYCWLHRMCRPCAKEIVTGQPTTAYLGLVMQRIRMLRQAGVVPVMVFDGADMPLKAETNLKRRSKREAAVRQAQALEAEGRLLEARTDFMTGLEVSPQLAHSVMKVLQSHCVECIVAPYEADAQLAYLCHIGYIDMVMTEDSDLIAYLTPAVLFKVDHSGNGVLVRSSRLTEVKDLSFTLFNPDMILTNFIMAGCDYLPSLHGIGIKKANKLVREYKSITRILEAIQHNPRFSTAAQQVGGYELSFLKAFFAFKHHLVYDPKKEAVVHFRPLGERATMLDQKWVEEVVGKAWDPRTAVSVCRDLTCNPVTLESYSEEMIENVSRFLNRTAAQRAEPTRVTKAAPAPFRAPRQRKPEGVVRKREGKKQRVRTVSVQYFEEGEEDEGEQEEEPSEVSSPWSTLLQGGTAPDDHPPSPPKPGEPPTDLTPLHRTDIRRHGKRPRVLSTRASCILTALTGGATGSPLVACDYSPPSVAAVPSPAALQNLVTQVHLPSEPHSSDGCSPSDESTEYGSPPTAPHLSTAGLPPPTPRAIENLLSTPAPQLPPQCNHRIEDAAETLLITRSTPPPKLPPTSDNSSPHGGYWLQTTAEAAVDELASFTPPPASTPPPTLSACLSGFSCSAAPEAPQQHEATPSSLSSDDDEFPVPTSGSFFLAPERPPTPPLQRPAWRKRRRSVY